MTLVEQDVEGGVAGVSPSPDDRTLQAPQARRAMVLSDPHPFADARVFGSQGDRTAFFTFCQPTDRLSGCRGCESGDRLSHGYVPFFADTDML
jgi:hypothetical protein